MLKSTTFLFKTVILLLLPLMMWISYPADARDYGIMGTATISFVVGKEGDIQNVFVVNGVCGSIKNECYRIMAAMPPWNPGYAEGHPVKVRFTLPVRFRLE